MSTTFEIVIDKVNKLLSKKRDALVINHINNALNVIHETEYNKILDYLLDKGVNITSITDIPQNNDKVKVYYVKKNTIIGDHVHEFDEYYICLFGKIKIKIFDEINIINSFDTFKVEKYEPHSIEYMEDTFLVVFAK